MVLQLLPHEAIICSLSTKFELIQPADLTIYASDPSFSQTGLKAESYLVFHSIHAEPLELFNSAKWLGTVENEIKRKVEDWWGEPFVQG